MNRIIFQSRSIRFYFSESHNGNYIRVITLSKPSLELLKEEKENQRALKLSTLSSLAVPELEDSPSGSGEVAALEASLLFRDVGSPEISYQKKKKIKTWFHKCY